MVQVSVSTVHTAIATPPTTDPLDFLAIDALLSRRGTADPRHRPRLGRANVLPEVGDWFERDPARELAQELGQLGLLGMHLDGYGCAGASAVAYGLACLELEAGDSGFRSFVSVQGSLAMFPIWRWGPRSRSSEWLPRDGDAGEAIGCFGLTEPDAGWTRARCARRRSATAATGS